MGSSYNKFFLELDERGYYDLIYWDRESDVRAVLKLNSLSRNQIILKLKSINHDNLIEFLSKDYKLYNDCFIYNQV